MSFLPDVWGALTSSPVQGVLTESGLVGTPVDLGGLDPGVRRRQVRGNLRGGMSPGSCGCDLDMSGHARGLGEDATSGRYGAGSSRQDSRYDVSRNDTGGGRVPCTGESWIGEGRSNDGCVRTRTKGLPSGEGPQTEDPPAAATHVCRSEFTTDNHHPSPVSNQQSDPKTVRRPSRRYHVPTPHPVGVVLEDKGLRRITSN